MVTDICTVDGSITTSKNNFDTKDTLTLFATILDILKSFIEEINPNTVFFTSDKTDSKSRHNIYMNLIKRYIPDGYQVNVKNETYRSTIKIEKK